MAATIVNNIVDWFNGTKDEQTQLSDEPDPLSGLSENEVYLLQISWDIVRKDIRGNATRLFEMLYEHNPTMITKLSAFKGVAVEDIRSTKTALAHAVTTLSSMDNLVINSPDSGCLAALLVKFGRDHIRRKVYKEDFEGMPEGFAAFVKEAIGPAWNDAIANAWMKFLTYIVNGSFDFL